MTGKMNRREVVKTITVVIGGVTTMLALPATWTRPVIESIVAPAHAALSGPGTTTGSPTTTVTTTGSPTTTVTTTGSPTTTATTTGAPTTTPTPTTTGATTTELVTDPPTTPP